MLNFKLDFMDKEVINFCSYIIKNYIDSNKEMDEKFVIECVEEIKKIKSLEDYIKNIQFNNKMKDVADYQLFTNILSFNIVKLIKHIKKDEVILKEKVHNFKDAECKIYKYIRALILILHELEHANQCKIIKTQNSIESKIFTASFEIPDKLLNELIKLHNNQNFFKKTIINYKMNKYHKIYMKFYKYAPEERIASIKSSYLSSKVANQYEITDLEKWLELFTNITALRAYLKVYNPTSLYLSKINREYNSQQIEEIGKNLNLYERVLYGLEISEEELNELIEETLEFKTLIKT